MSTTLFIGMPWYNGADKHADTRYKMFFAYLGRLQERAALRAGMDLPYACKGGMCSTCRAKIVEGETRMDVNYSLEPWELEAGFVLTCQAHPVSSRVVVDYDQM